MEPIYRKAYIELDRPEERLKFYTIEAEKLTARGREGLPVTDACKPLFVVYKVSGAGRARRRAAPCRNSCLGPWPALGGELTVPADSSAFLWAHAYTPATLLPLPPLPRAEWQGH